MKAIERNDARSLCAVLIMSMAWASPEYTWKNQAWSCQSQEACGWPDLGNGIKTINSDNDNTNFECPTGNDPSLWINSIKVNNDENLGIIFCVSGTSGSGKNDDGLTFSATGGGTGVA